MPLHHPSSLFYSAPPLLVHCTQQLRLQYELPLLVLLVLLIRLIVLPPHRLLALFAADIPHQVFSRRHVALVCGAFFDVDDFGEEEGFAVLAAEVL